MKTIKYLTLYSIEDHQPIAFAKQPGNLPDVTSLSNTLEQLETLGVHGAEIVTDNGYYSEENLASMCLTSFRFITLVETSSAWVRRELDAHMDGIVGIENRQADLGGIYCCTVMLMHPFQKICRYASRKKGLAKGDTETFEKRLYLHLYYNPIKKENDDATKEILGMELKLKKWLEDTSFSNILRWFDAYETKEVSTTVANRRWSSEITKRNPMFLRKLGM